MVLSSVSLVKADPDTDDSRGRPRAMAAAGHGVVGAALRLPPSQGRAHPI
jgi:hypothetical protein